MGGFKKEKDFSRSLDENVSYWQNAMQKVGQAKDLGLDIKGPYSFSKLHTKDELADYKNRAEKQFKSMQTMASDRFREAQEAKEDYSSWDKLKMRLSGVLGGSGGEDNENSFLNILKFFI